MHRVAGARPALVAVALVWAALLIGIVRQPVFLTTDMVSNHVHIWYVAEQLWHDHRIPLRMPVLASGNAYAFPYALLPWLAGALLWPLGGDRVVTAVFVVGILAFLAATFWALPRLRRGWWAVAVLVNPSLVVSVMLGQLPFLWAAAAFMLAIGMWRRQREVPATVLATAALVTHPAVMLPVLLMTVVVAVPFEHRRRRLLLCSFIAIVVSLPATWMTVTSPVVDQTSRSTQLYSLVTTVFVRALVLGLPLLLDALAARWRERTALPVSFSLVSIVFVALAWLPFQLNVGWSGLVSTSPPNELRSFADTVALDPGRIYRVLPGADRKYELYQIVRHGAVLDSEFFPESLRRQGFASDEEYARFLAKRNVEVVVMTPEYASHYRSNEPARLESLAASGDCVAGVRVTAGRSSETWRAFDVARC